MWKPKQNKKIKLQVKNKSRDFHWRAVQKNTWKSPLSCQVLSLPPSPTRSRCDDLCISNNQWIYVHCFILSEVWNRPGLKIDSKRYSQLPFWWNSFYLHSTRILLGLYPQLQECDSHPLKKIWGHLLFFPEMWATYS